MCMFSIHFAVRLKLTQPWKSNINLLKNSLIKTNLKTCLLNLQAFNLLLSFARSFVSDSLRPHGPQHARLPCPSPSPGLCSVYCAALTVKSHTAATRHFLSGGQIFKTQERQWA